MLDALGTTKGLTAREDVHAFYMDQQSPEIQRSGATFSNSAQSLVEALALFENVQGFDPANTAEINKFDELWRRYDLLCAAYFLGNEGRRIDVAAARASWSRHTLPESAQRTARFFVADNSRARSPVATRSRGKAGAGAGADAAAQEPAARAKSPLKPKAKKAAERKAASAALAQQAAATKAANAAAGGTSDVEAVPAEAPSTKNGSGGRQ